MYNLLNWIIRVCKEEKKKNMFNSFCNFLSILRFYFSCYSFVKFVNYVNLNQVYLNYQSFLVFPSEWKTYDVKQQFCFSHSFHVSIHNIILILLIFIFMIFIKYEGKNKIFLKFKKKKIYEINNDKILIGNKVRICANEEGEGRKKECRIQIKI